MLKDKRIILVGPTCSGKTYMFDGFVKAGYAGEVSCTTRDPRPGEKDGVDYNFFKKFQFEQFIEAGMMYEYTKYGEHYYGTMSDEFYKADVFVWETEGLKQLKPEDRGSTLIIYVNTPMPLRMDRMKQRGWDVDKIKERLAIDEKTFKDFTNFDIEVQS